MPLFPTFHGMENENPYTHIQEFEEVFTTFKEGATDMDLLKLKAFPLTLKDKAKIWLNSLRPRTIRNWAELQVEFLKKFFNAHKTNSLKRQIYTFAAHDTNPLSPTKPSSHVNSLLKCYHQTQPETWPHHHTCRASIPPPRRTKGVRDCTGTLYFLFQTLVGSSLITESQ